MIVPLCLECQLSMFATKGFFVIFSSSNVKENVLHNLIKHLPLIDLGNLFWSLFDHQIIELNMTVLSFRRNLKQY